MMRRACLIVVVVLAGCSAKPTGPAPKQTVEGKVVAQGRPLPFVLVMFHPQDSADPNHYDGGTGQNGTFAVQCPKGTYKVTITALPVGAGGDPGAGGIVGPGSDAKGLKDVPQAYRNKDSTRLVVEVPEGGTKVELKVE